MIRVLIPLLSLTLLFSCASDPEDEDPKLVPVEREVLNPSDSLPIEEDIPKFVPDSSLMVAEYSFTVQESPNGGYGYSILQDGKMVIDQPHVPAVSGRNGFKSEEYASITASFAITKLQQGMFPPTISIDELDSLGVIDQ